MEFIHTFIT